MKLMHRSTTGVKDYKLTAHMPESIAVTVISCPALYTAYLTHQYLQLT
jgi:hypothetical protein